MKTIEHDLERFYSLIALLDALPPQGCCLRQQSCGALLPARGVYFFREPGESRKGAPEKSRIVRVGTHAVSVGSKSTLWGRLRQHRGTKVGTGNHRGSIFRLHVGAALLARDGASLSTWGQKSSASKSVRQTEAFLERKVSEHIGAMSVLWIDAPDEPGPGSIRSRIERNAIALLSNHFHPVDEPSEGWLGNFSPRLEIRQSALWNLNYVEDDYDKNFLDTLEQCVERTIGVAAVKP